MLSVIRRIKNVNKIAPMDSKINMMDKATNTEIIYTEIELQRLIMYDIEHNYDVMYVCRKYGKPPEYIAYVLLSNKVEINRIELFTGLSTAKILLSYLQY